jgi:hypothetical protein
MDIVNDTLAELVEKIRFEIGEAETAGRSRVEHAITAGRYIKEVQQRVGRGLKGWLAEHALNRATAYNYMLLAENAESVYRARHSSIRAALKMLRGKPSKSADKSEKPPHGRDAWLKMAPQERRKFLDTISKAVRQALSLTKTDNDTPSVSALAALRAINNKLEASGMDLNCIVVVVDPSLTQTRTQRRRAA